MIPALLAVASMGLGLAQHNEAKKPAKIDRQARRIEAYKARVQAVREAQMVTATQNNAAAVAGVQESSGFVGGQSSIASQLGAGISGQLYTSALLERAGKAEQRASDLGVASKVLGAMSNFGSSAEGQAAITSAKETGAKVIKSFW